jgi:hypothetical protein
MNTSALDAVIDDVVNAEAAIEVDDAEEDAVSAAGEEQGTEDEADPDPRSHIDPPDRELPVATEGATPRGVAFPAISQLLGIPLFYERPPVGPPPRPHSFPVDPAFVPILEQTLRELQQRAPSTYGRLMRISSAGMEVAKEGMHGKGRACDWDRLVFEHTEIAPIAHAHAGPSKASQRYWGFAAICRANSSFVLHGFYNTEHEDHIHQDNMVSIAFNPNSETGVKLVQAVLNRIFGQSPALAIDGHFGHDTKQALTRAIARVGLRGPVEQAPIWRKFLRRSGWLGLVLGSEV